MYCTCNVCPYDLFRKLLHSFLNLLCYHTLINKPKQLQSYCIRRSTNILQLICQAKLEAEQFQFARNFSFDNCQHTSTFFAESQTINVWIMFIWNIQLLCQQIQIHIIRHSNIQTDNSTTAIIGFLTEENWE